MKFNPIDPPDVARAERIHEEVQSMLDQIETADLFRCVECGHRGPAVGKPIYERHPYGDGYATETLIDEVECQRCGSNKVNLINE